MTIRVGTTHSSKVQYIEEHEAKPVTFSGPVSAEVESREWDVNDPDLRDAAAEEQLGEGANEDDWYAKHAMWFVNSDANAAVLIVFRPKVEVKA